MNKDEKIYLVGKDVEEGVAYAKASVKTEDGEVEAVVLFENAYDAYKFVGENFKDEEGMTIYQTTISAIEELEEETTFILMKQSEEAKNHVMAEENEDIIYS